MQNHPQLNGPLLRVEALRNEHLGPISLSVWNGECVAIRGPSGAGKTLFLRAVAELDPSVGQVWLQDIPRSAIPAPRWRRQVGLLAAESHWWAETVGAHFPLDCSENLTRLGFAQDALGWEIARLSSGERQRLALARLLINQPRVLLLDEPTANLDEANQRQVEGLVRDYLHDSKACALWVSHDTAQAARMAERTVRFLGGRIDDRA